MAFNSPEIQTLKISLDGCVQSALKHKPNSHAAIKNQSLLHITVYVLACRFLEGSVKHVVYSCLTMKGSNEVELNDLASRLKKFNNPEFANIRQLLQDELHYDISLDKGTGYSARDISYLNEICIYRHRNVHASQDPKEWHNTNNKTMTDFQKEYNGLLNIVSYLDCLIFDTNMNSFKYQQGV